jgi:hypothetical protein
LFIGKISHIDSPFNMLLRCSEKSFGGANLNSNIKTNLNEIG